MKEVLKGQAGVILAAVIVLLFGMSNALGAPVDDGYTQLIVGALVGGTTAAQLGYNAGKRAGGVE